MAHGQITVAHGNCYDGATYFTSPNVTQHENAHYINYIYHRVNIVVVIRLSLTRSWTPRDLLELWHLELTKFPGKVFKSSAFNSRAAAGYTSLSLVESNARKQRANMLRIYETRTLHRSELTNMANILFHYALKQLWPNDRSLYRSVSNSCSGGATISPLRHLARCVARCACARLKTPRESILKILPPEMTFLPLSNLDRWISGSP